ncbi:MAG: HAD family hydrolase [Bacteroidota bacterium]
MNKKLIIFDIDGTLTNTNEVDHQSFIKSYADLYDVHVNESIWEQCEHYTDTGIASYIFESKIGRPIGPVDIRKIKNKMLDNLLHFMESEQNSFNEVAGANDFIELLKKNNQYELAIATGCWEATADLKLNIAGIDYEDLPLANCDHHISRAGIIEKAIELAKEKNSEHSYDKIIYFGDGLWDIKSTDALQIPLIGIDCNKTGVLSNAGVKTVFNDYKNTAAILKAIESI